MTPGRGGSLLRWSRGEKEKKTKFPEGKLGFMRMAREDSPGPNVTLP